MYGGGGGFGGGGGGGWTPWAGGGGLNPQMMQQQQQQQQQQQAFRSGAMNQQGGFAGNATAVNPNMMSLGGGMNYGGANVMTGMGIGGIAGMYGMNSPASNPSLLMGTNSMANNMYGMTTANAYGQQQQNNPYLQQQQHQQMQNLQQQQQNQSIFQTQPGYPRPQQPPLPPGPPPPSKDTTGLSSRPNNPPLPPPSNNYGISSSGNKPPPPPLPKSSPTELTKGSSGPGGRNYRRPESSTFNANQNSSGRKHQTGEPVIPDQILKLLENAESARQMQQIDESLSNVSAISSLNVSQDLFGVKTDAQNEKIPGLDFDDVQKDLMENMSSFLPGKNISNAISNKNSESSTVERVARVDIDKIQDNNFGSAAKPAAYKSRWGEANASAENEKNQKTPSDRNESTKSPEIVWELRPEVQDEISSVGPKEIQENQPNSKSGQMNFSSPKTPLSSLSSKSGNQLDEGEKRLASGDGDNSHEDNVDAVSAKIPLEPKDGKPVEYDKRTLRAFDKKFREWEQEFENWKAANQNHPDRNAYNKYMEQWDRWRQQLIEQRRFIIDSMNQAKLEGAELAMQKLERDIREGRYEQTENETGMKENSHSSGTKPPELDSRFSKDPKSTGWQDRQAPFGDKVTSEQSNRTPWEEKGGRNAWNQGSRTPPWKENEEESGWNNGRTPPWERNEDFVSETEKFVKNPHFRGTSEDTHPQASGFGPKPLMGITVEPPIHQKEPSMPNPFQPNVHLGGSGGISSPNPFAIDGFQATRNPSANESDRSNDRLVERIPRDKDRPMPLLGNRPPPDVRNKNNAPTTSNDRIPRDPQEGRQGSSLRNRVNQDLLDPDPWAAMNKSNVNPFQAVANSQTSNAPQGGWGRTSEDNLPKLSDFLQRSDVSNSELASKPGLRGTMMNRSGMLENPSGSYSNQYSDEISGVRRDRLVHSVPETQFNRRGTTESTYKGVPFAQASGSRPFHTLLAPDSAEYKYDEDEIGEQEACQWFTRDRSRAFEDEEDPSFQDEPPAHESNEYEWEPDTAAVIDYGHGSKGTDNRDEYDLPKGERIEDDDETDEERDRDVVTIDYGHGSSGTDFPGNEDFTRERFPVRRRLPEPDDEYYEQEEAYNESYQQEVYHGHRDYESGSSYQGGRGMGISRGRGNTRGRGRGVPIATPLPPSQMIRRPPDLGYGREPQQPSALSRVDGRGILPAPEFAPREMSRPVPNRGGGRGVPIQLPIYSAEPESATVGRGRGAFADRKIGRNFEDRTPYEDKEDLGTERVDSPEIMMIHSPRREDMVRRAPRENSRDDRSRDRIPRERDSVRNSSRDRDFKHKRPERHQSREDFTPSAFLEESWEPEDQQENKKTERVAPKRDEDLRRVRRDNSPPVRRDRERDRERDRDREKDSSRDRHGSRFRKRSRSPLFDRGGSFQNASSSSGSTVQGLNSSGMIGGVNPPAPRYQTVMVEDILNKPGRLKRPSQIVVILRGLPGSGKTHVAKLMKDREVEMGGSAPRILSLDDYFMTESENTVKDPVTGTESKETLMQYEFEEDLEPKYRNDLIKTFKKTVDTGYFQFIIVDCVNVVVKHFEEIVSYGTQKRFQVYVAEVDESVETCVKRNIHNRTRDHIQKLQKIWERTPPNFIKLDIRPLLQDEAVQDVEMEDVSDTENVETAQVTKAPISTPATESWEDDENDRQVPETSKWETFEQSEEKLNRLDGLNVRRKHSDDDKVDAKLGSSIDSWLHSHLPEDYVSRQKTHPGQKRVRWADIEEKRAQERMRDVGFVVGHTDWNRMTDPTFGSSALTKTKYI